MIEIDIEKLNQANVNDVVAFTGQVIRDWNAESKYFTSVSGHPLMNKDTFNQLLNAIGSRFRELSSQHNALVQKIQKNPNADSNYSSDISMIIDKSKSFFELYSQLKALNDSCFPLQRTEELFLNKLHEIEQTFILETKTRIDRLSSNLTTTIESKVSVLSESIDEQISGLSANLEEKVAHGIKDLIGLKSELGLAKEFGGKIQSELEAAQKKEQRFMLAFIIALVLIPVSVFCTNSLTEGMTDAVSGYILKGSIAISLLFVSLFFFSQYRTYMMIRLRYTHLDGFLGGGATFISQLLEADSPDLKLEVNKKLAEMFMSLDDVLKMVQKSKHPTELTLETAETVFDKISKFKK